MATRPLLDAAALHRQELARRWALAREPSPDDARGPRALLLLAELGYIAEPVARLFRTIDVAPAVRPRTVMLLPGFATHPIRMRYMARHLERAGHTVKRWGQGFNLGASTDGFAKLEQRLMDLHRRAGEPIVLVGWSLGGVMAREIAKLHPGNVSKVITMGSPFSGSPRANNAWRAYQAIAGHRVDHPPIDAAPAVKPPVETVAIWSPRDGIVHPRCACGRPRERDRAIALRCSHMGFVRSAEAIHAVLGELDAPSSL